MKSLGRCASEPRLRAKPRPMTGAEMEPAAMPKLIAMLDQLHVRVTATKTKQQRGVMAYTMEVSHAQTNAQWRFTRPFNDYQSFNKRVLGLLQRGHFCTAECPWLYSFLKGYFPKRRFFIPATNALVAATRAKTMERVLQTIKTFLLNRTNHVCPILTQEVAYKVVQFLHGDTALGLQVVSVNDVRLVSPRVTYVTEEEDNNQIEEMRMDDTATGVCLLCSKPLQPMVQAAASKSAGPGMLTHASKQLSRRHSAPPTNPRKRGSLPKPYCYTTVLRCGHEFHDECIIAKLNDSLTCPECGHAQTSEAESS